MIDVGKYDYSGQCNIEIDLNVMMMMIMMIDIRHEDSGNDTNGDIHLLVLSVPWMMIVMNR